jgi:PTS system cellobiose-specific IIC component
MERNELKDEAKKKEQKNIFDQGDTDILDGLDLDF